MKKTKSFLGGGLLVLALMFTSNVSFGQGNVPTYSESTYQSYIQNLKSGLQTIVLDRFDSFTNDELHELAELSTSRQNVRNGKQASDYHQSLQVWMDDNLTTEEKQTYSEAYQTTLGKNQ